MRIDNHHIELWALSLGARDSLPRWIRRLILSSVTPTKLRMPFGKAVWMPGPDGILFCEGGNQFIPTGHSRWEAGTDKDFRAKASRDFRTRTDELAPKTSAMPIDRGQITFVFVTPWLWPDKADWEQERKAEGIWKDVIVIDGEDFKNWLETSLAVSLQFAAEAELVPDAGLSNPDDAWDELSGLTDPPMSEALVTAGRSDQEKELLGRLAGPPGIFTVRADSPREAWAFVLATIRKLEVGAEREALQARTIVVDDENIAAQLRNVHNHIFVLKKVREQPSAFLVRRGCHIIVPAGNEYQSAVNVIVLARPSHRQVVESLLGMKVPEADAERFTRECGLSVTIFLRQRAPAGAIPPSWTATPSVLNLMPALLAGQWNDNSASDRQILCQLAGASRYEEVLGYIGPLLLVDETPLQKIGEMWTLTAPVDAFQLAARHLSYEHFARFKEVCISVFSRIDPKVDIPPDEWLLHDIRGDKGPSAWLRSGLAESALLIATRGNDAHIVVVTPQKYVEDLIRGIPGVDNWKFLASVRDQIPRLMEAAPLPLLEGLERYLEVHPDDLRKLFSEGDSIFGGGSMHTGLLWALEELGWSTDYLPRVSLILAKLATIDPGGKLLNRPANSLREIFQWWNPGTAAATSTKLAVIDQILERYERVGWNLLAGLIPSGRNSISHGVSKPRWRDFGDIPSESLSRAGQWKYASAIIDRAISNVRQIPNRWEVLLNALPAISPAQVDRALALLDVSAEEVSPDQRAALWAVVRDYVALHRTFEEARWAASKSILERLTALVERLRPTDVLEANRWLFDEWLPELPSGEQNIELRQKKIEVLRSEAVAAVLDAAGIDGLVTLAISCRYSGLLAISAARLLNDASRLMVLVHCASEKGDNGVFFASHLSGEALKLHGDLWRQLVRAEAKSGAWPGATVAAMLIWWPDGRATWEEALALGDDVANEYWRRKPIGLPNEVDADQIYEIDQLIKAERAVELLDRVAYHTKAIPSGTLIKLFDAMIKELSQPKSENGKRIWRLSSHDVQEFLKAMGGRGDIPREEVARREYQALPLLGPLAVPGLAIYSLLAQDAEFFVDVICHMYLPASRDRSVELEPSAEAKARAHSAFTLLSGMHVIPGMDASGKFDEHALMIWIERVRTVAAERDRAIVADQHIGKVLAHAPNDPKDGGWPHVAVRRAVEAVKAEHIGRGIITERYNMRGVHSKALYEGGDQERELAATYRSWAEISRSQWPTITAVLDAIARNWLEEARRADERAEQDKIQL